MNNYVVYKHTNKINGKIYIGQTNQKPEYRWGSHGQNYKSAHFKAAIDKYGWDNFEHEILYENLSLEEANKIEKELIQKYKSTDPTYGYNSNGGGDNKIPNKDTRYLESISAQNKPIVSDKTKQKLSQVGKGRQRTKETRQKISKASLERERKRNGRKFISVVCENTGEYFPSVRSAANWCGLTGTSGIASVCNHGKQKTAGVHPVTKEKLIWRYATVEEDANYEMRVKHK